MRLPLPRTHVHTERLARLRRHHHQPGQYVSLIPSFFGKLAIHSLTTGLCVSRAVLSTAMMLFLVITYILSPRKRRFPTSFQLWVCVSSLISSIGIDIAVVVGGTTLIVLHVCRVVCLPI